MKFRFDSNHLPLVPIPTQSASPAAPSPPTAALEQEKLSAARDKAVSKKRRWPELDTANIVEGSSTKTRTRRAQGEF